MKAAKKFHVLLMGILWMVVPFASAQSENLLSNAGFEDGRFDFGTWPQVTYLNPGFTSEYGSQHHSDLYAEGVYAIGSSPNTANPNFRSISAYEGNNMLIVNGATQANVTVWQTSISNIAQHTAYEFEAFVTNVNNANLALPILEFQIFDLTYALNDNWRSIGIIDLGAVEDANAWNSFRFTWNSNSNISTQLRLINLQTAPNGNDFAMDALNFAISSDAVPEPGTALLFGTGALALLMHRRSRARRRFPIFAQERPTGMSIE